MPTPTITLIRAALPIKCPECGAAISWRHATADVQFLCPECGHGLRVRNNYFRVLYLLAVVVVILAAYAAGLRGEPLFATVVLGLVPAHFLLVFITMRLFPPDIESTGDFRGILYGSLAPEHVSTAVSPASTHAADGPNGRGMFRVGQEHRTLAGVVLCIGAGVLGVSIVWMAAAPVIHRFAPQFGATKEGPLSFPVRVHIGDDTIAFTNGSTEAWTCNAELGLGDEHTTRLSIGPQQTRELSYLDFRGSDRQVQAAALRDAARELITVDCAEGSGKRHFWQFR